jgi:hypothetical protein
MSIKLVVDNGEAIELSAIGLADELQKLDLDGVSSLVTIALGENGSSIQILGEQLSLYALMGIFEAAKFEMMSDLLEHGE